MRLSLFALLVLGAAAVVSAQSDEDLGPEDWKPEPYSLQTASKTDEKLCIAIDRYGCWFAPESIRESNAPTLLVFFRGWRDNRERSNIPPEERVESARQAFVQFDLENAARSKNAALLVTGSPKSAATTTLVRRLESA